MIFLDMDGTLAKFYANPNYLERMYEQGYFSELQPYATVEYFNRLLAQGDRVVILSACVETAWCEQEKKQWLAKYMPALRQADMIFVKVGENKAAAAQAYMDKHKLSGKAVLLDDYSKNLHEWVAPIDSSIEFIPVKFCNGLNNKTGKNYKYKVKTNKQIHKLLQNLGEVD